MINTVPESWKYSDKMQNLFLFFQRAEEALSFNTIDSYRLPVCNSITLREEIRRIYRFLSKNNQIEKYYSKYIPSIIDELIDSIKKDFVLKEKLGVRKESIIAGLTSAKKNHMELLRWLDLLAHLCTLEEHLAQCKAELIRTVRSNCDQKILLWCVDNFFIDLKSSGYSTEYLYQSVIRFFDSREKNISSLNCIEYYCSQFTRDDVEYEFYLVVDTFKFDAIQRIDNTWSKSIELQIIDEKDLESQRKNNQSIKKLIEKYLELKKRGETTVKIVSCKCVAFDPYTALEMVSKLLQISQWVEGYFKHQSERKIIYDACLRSNDRFISVRLRRVIPNRPYIDQDTIDKRMEAVLSSHTSITATMLNAMDMHLDAINCRNSETMLRSFWTALEALFFEADYAAGERENAKYCVLHIVQKTYLLKQFRQIYSQLQSAIRDSAFWEEFCSSNFSNFIEAFMGNDADSDGFRKITTYLSNNPLLRNRIYWFRKSLSSNKEILNKLQHHKEKVSWHIDRIYRTRNLSTHAGLSMPYIDEILFNLHNYFDYVINYLLCMIETGNYKQSVSSAVFEAKNDNAVHEKILANEKVLSQDNWMLMLFGPDQQIINYNFEIDLCED